MRTNYVVLVALKEVISKRAKDPGFESQLGEHMTTAFQQLQELQRLLHLASSPFIQMRGPVSLSQIAVPVLPTPQDYESLFNASHFAIRELYGVQRRILGRMAITAEKVEQTLELR
jgi:hypothetical protein